VASHRFGNSFYRYLLASGRIFGFGEYGFKRFSMRGQTVTMRLLRRTAKAKKKWRRKAWLVDHLSKTRIVLLSTEKPGHVALR
jgi:hypothetical protein